jgi:hypothetical protein
MDMEVSFGHFNLYDDDYKLEGNKKTPYINPELRYIIGTTPFGIKDKDKEKNNNGIKFSDMYEHNFDKNLKESIKINLNLNAESNKTTVKMSMSKLTIIQNFSTLSRLYMFLNKYLELYKESMNKIKNEKLAEKMKEEKLNSIKSNDSMESQLNKKKIDDNIKKKEETKEVSLKKGIIKTKVYSLIDVEFSMKGIDSDYVAKYAIDKMLRKNKLLIVPGFKIKSLIFFNIFISTKRAAKVVYKFQKRKRK